MSERKDTLDSNVVESTSGVTEEKVSTHDEDENISSTASKTETRIINVEDGIADVGNILHAASTALASQIKKIAPSINIFDKPAAEVVKEPSDTSLTSKSTSSTYVQPVKVVQFGSVRKLSIIPEIVKDDTAELDEQSTRESINETIKKIPASMNVKRQRRNTLMILPKETPRHTKLLNKLRDFSSTLYEYQLWDEHLKTIEGVAGINITLYRILCQGRNTFLWSSLQYASSFSVGVHNFIYYLLGYDGSISELTEVRRKKELKERSFKAWLKLYSIRVLINILVIVWIAVCYILIYNVAAFQMNEQRKNKLLAAGFRTLMIQYLPPFTVTSISAVSPMFFNFLISFEKYHGQTEVNISLIRNVFVSLSSIIVLVNTFHREVTCTPKDVCGAGIGPNCKTPICWETYVGQQLYKLNLSQLFVIVASFVLVDVPRACLVKNCKLSKLIGHATFFLPTEVLVAIYSQTILWLGVFYSPLLPLVTVIKLIVLFYVKKTKVLKCSQQPKVLYKASRFNSTFINILLLSFFAVLAVHFYTLKNIRPSLGCTPFSHYNSMVNALRAAFQFLPFDIVFFFKLILSGWFFIPCSIILCTTIFYYQRHIEFLKDMEENLKTELTLLGQDKKFILQRIEALAKMM